MQCNNKRRVFRMAACGVAAFVLCFAFSGATHIAAAAPDKKACNKGYRAVRKGDYEQAESRSEERRVGKEWRSRWGACDEKKKKKKRGVEKARRKRRGAISSRQEVGS